MREYNQARRATGDTFHESPEWRRVAKAFLRRHRTCRCGAPATEVDHRKPRPRGAPLDRQRWDAETNLQALCSRCHKAKTMAETNARRGGGGV